VGRLGIDVVQQHVHRQFLPYAEASLYAVLSAVTSRPEGRDAAAAQLMRGGGMVSGLSRDRNVATIRKCI